MLFGKNFFEPVRLSLCNPLVRIVDDGEQLTTLIAAERPHVSEAHCSLVSVALLDCSLKAS